MPNERNVIEMRMQAVCREMAREFGADMAEISQRIHALRLRVLDMVEAKKRAQSGEA